MSAPSSATATPIQPLHNPTQAAVQPPLGNATNGGLPPGMGAKALLAKKMAKNNNPSFVSPTDNLMTPCTQKISAAKKKHFTNGTKPVQLFAHKESSSSSDGEQPAGPKMNDDDENPF